MPKLWTMSDLHLEAIPYPEAFQPKTPDFDILVVPGDVWQGDCVRAFRFLRRLAGEKPVVFVMGNHEHWNGVLHEDLELAKVVAAEYGITLLDGEAQTVGGCTFIGSTLWSDYRLTLAGANPEALTGEQIEIAHDDGTHLITVGDAISLHEAARRRIVELVRKADRGLPVVAVTHHAPHPDCLTEGMKKTWSAGNSASDLSEIIETDVIDLWLHGHLHHRVDIVRGNRTRILCNPAGPGFSNLSFDEGMVVEV